MPPMVPMRMADAAPARPQHAERAPYREVRHETAQPPSGPAPRESAAQLYDRGCGWKCTDGLPVIDHKRPILVLGSDLAAFLSRRREARRQPCLAGQIFCLKCRRPQDPAGRMADFVASSTTAGALMGICHARFGRAFARGRERSRRPNHAGPAKHKGYRHPQRELSFSHKARDMRQHNAENERIKRDYLIYLKAAKGMSEASLDTVAKAIHRFEVSTRFRSFRKFHVEQAVAFRRQLCETDGCETGKPLSKATALQTVNALRAFVLWLAGLPGYRSRISYSDAEYFRLSEKDTRIAKAVRERPVPTLQQIRGVLAAMPGGTEIERRNRALIAFTLLTGVRDGALASLKLKHVDLVAAKVVQDASEVNTKFSRLHDLVFPGGR
jgi:hypothetical protein